MRDHGPWKILSSREVYRDPWTALRRDEVIRPDGQPGSHCVIEVKRGICVLAVDRDRHVYLTDEFHYAVGRRTLEAVSGGIEPGEPADLAAQRELQEELGILAKRWTPLGELDPFTTIVASPTRLYLAEDLEFVQDDPEGTEHIAQVRMSFSEALGGVFDGRITHGPTCVTILKAHLWLSGQSPLPGLSQPSSDR